MNKTGIIFNYGTMGSGKSLLLIAKAKTYDFQNKKYIILSYAEDNRFGENIIASRNGESLPCIKFNNNTILTDILYDKDLHCILIDEAQFLTEIQVNQLIEIQFKYKCLIMAYGLKTDFMNNLFPGSKKLIEAADILFEIDNECHLCKNNATHNMRLNNNIPTFNGNVCMIGSDNYIAVCRHCYFKAKNNLR